MQDHDHFEGKGVQEHLKKALLKGRRIQEHAHTPPLPTHLFSMGEAMKELIVLLSLLFLISFFLHDLKPGLPFLSCSLTIFWALYKGINASLIGFEKLGRMHKLVEEESHEIKHNRKQEKEELTAMYRLKGFEEPLLSQVIDVLMADDHRLLMVMLEEELGMQLESEEHPIKRGLFTTFGTFTVGAIASLGFYFFSPPLAGLTLFIVLLASAIFAAKVQAVHKMQSVIWALAISALALGLSYVALVGLIK